MIFDKLQPGDANGNVLQQLGDGTYPCRFTGDTSPQLTCLPTVDDEGDVQTITMKTKVADSALYEFTGALPTELKHTFSTDQNFSFPFQIKKKTNDALPCCITSTIFYVVTDGQGKQKRKQRSLSIFLSKI